MEIKSILHGEYYGKVSGFLSDNICTTEMILLSRCSIPWETLRSPGRVAVGGGHAGLKNNQISDRFPFTDGSDKLSNA